MIRQRQLLRQSRQLFAPGTRSRGLIPISSSTAAWSFWISLSVSTVASGCYGIHMPTKCSSRRKPPSFGPSIRSYTTTTTSGGSFVREINLEDRENCPICEKYSQGPCGKLFQTWLKCTDKHPGRDPDTQQDLHLTHCAAHANALADCLDQNQSYYEKPFQDSLENTSHEEEMIELKQAWERLIQEDLTDISRKSYPSQYQPQVEFRPRDRLAVIFMSLQDIVQDQSLLLVFVQDERSKTLLSAGSLDDLLVFPKDGRPTGVLQCTLPDSTENIVVSALYERPEHSGIGSDKQIIYTYSARVPKKG